MTCWPWGVIEEDDWTIAPGNLAFPEAIDGSRVVIATMTDRWTARVVLKIRHRDVSAARAWQTRRRGRLLPDQVGPRREFAGAVKSGSTPGAAGATFDDDATFDDGGVFAEGGWIAGNIALRGTTATIVTPGTGAYIREGRFFGIAGRLYQIIEVLASDEHSASVRFWPPARAGYGDGTPLDERPTAPMMLTDDDAGRLSDTVRRDNRMVLVLEEKPW